MAFLSLCYSTCHTDMYRRLPCSHKSESLSTSACLLPYQVRFHSQGPNQRCFFYVCCCGKPVLNSWENQERTNFAWSWHKCWMWSNVETTVGNKLLKKNLLQCNPGHSEMGTFMDIMDNRQVTMRTNKPVDSAFAHSDWLLEHGIAFAIQAKWFLVFLS